MRKIVSPIVLCCFFLFVSYTPVTAGFISCFDDFYKTSTCNWNEITSPLGLWQIQNSSLFGQSQFVLSESEIFKLAGENDWTDYSIEADVLGIEGVDKILTGRFQNLSHNYLLNLRSGFDTQGNDLLLVKTCCNGHRKNLSTVPYPNINNQWYRLRLEFVGTNIKAFVNDQLLINYNDISYPELPLLTGKTGVGVWAGNYTSKPNPLTKVLFDNIKIKKITPSEIYILIPGLGASWNLTSILSCGLSVTNNWTLAPYASIYDRLMNTFSSNQILGKNFYLYTYDWRQSLDKQADQLKAYLDTVISDKTPNTKINVIGHSLGGLVIRSFINKYPNYYSFGKIITLGSPFLGTTNAYEIWEGGEIPVNDWYLKLALNIMFNSCSNKLNIVNKPQIIHQVIPSIKDLLPIFPYLKNENGEIIPLSNLYETNTFLNSLKKISVNFTTISGNNNDTLETLRVASASSDELENGFWIDGKPIGFERVREGDNTVLLKSAVLPESNSVIIPHTNHNELVYSDLGIDTILDQLNLSEITIAPQKKESDLHILSKPFSLQYLQPFTWKRYKLKL